MFTMGQIDTSQSNSSLCTCSLFIFMNARKGTRGTECLNFDSLDRRLSHKNNRTVLQIATVKSLNLRADCHRPDLSACILCHLSAELGNPQCTWEGFAKELFPLWQTAAFWPRSLASEWIPVPILNRQFLWLLRHEFLTRDFLSVWYAADWLDLNCTPMVSVDTQPRDTIPLNKKGGGVTTYGTYHIKLPLIRDF
jgi:hypothetical protein